MNEKQFLDGIMMIFLGIMFFGGFIWIGVSWINESGWKP